MKPVVICTMGFPRSGKSTWVKNFARQYPGVGVVNADAVRMALYGQRFIRQAEGVVWETVRLMVHHNIEYGVPVTIIDETCVTRWARDKWKSDDWDTYYKPFPASKEDCISRTKHDDLRYAIIRMSEQYELLNDDEMILTELVESHIISMLTDAANKP